MLSVVHFNSKVSCSCVLKTHQLSYMYVGRTRKGKVSTSLIQKPSFVVVYWQCMTGVARIKVLMACVAHLVLHAVLITSH